GPPSRRARACSTPPSADSGAGPSRPPRPATSPTGTASSCSSGGGVGRGATGLLAASAGGVGGCPFAPRATGNVATEDVLYLLERERVETGVDLEALIGVARWLARLARGRAPA